jgi:hypothetical protein
VGREIEKYKREREEEMRNEEGGIRRALSKKLNHWGFGGGALSSLMSPHG